MNNNNLTEVYVKVDVKDRLPDIDDVYAVISTGCLHPEERRYIKEEERWCYPYEKGVDTLYDNNVTHWLELQHLPQTQTPSAVPVQGYSREVIDKWIEKEKASSLGLNDGGGYVILDMLTEFLSTLPTPKDETVSEQEIDYKAKYEKCIDTIKKFDPGIIGMYDL